MAQEITLARVVQAGVVPMDTAAVASELQRTWNRPDAAEWAEVYTKVFPAYQLLIESYSKAQDVVKNNEQLQRGIVHCVSERQRKKKICLTVLTQLPIVAPRCPPKVSSKTIW